MIRIIDAAEPLTFGEEDVLTLIASAPHFTRWQRARMKLRLWHMLVREYFRDKKLALQLRLKSFMRPKSVEKS